MWPVKTEFVALWWQINTGNKWKEMGKIHGIRKIYICAFGCQNKNTHFFIEYCHQRRHFKLNADVETDRVWMKTALLLKYSYDLINRST